MIRKFIPIAQYSLFYLGTGLLVNAVVPSVASGVGAVNAISANLIFKLAETYYGSEYTKGILKLSPKNIIASQCAAIDTGNKIARLWFFPLVWLCIEGLDPAINSVYQRVTTTSKDKAEPLLPFGTLYKLFRSTHQPPLNKEDLSLSSYFSPFQSPKPK